MGFKLILDLLEAKIHPSEISQKMKEFIFMSNSDLVKSTMTLSKGEPTNSLNFTQRFLYSLT
jgi:hypothetical protein